jgi:hypothetical protein
MLFNPTSPTDEKRGAMAGVPTSNSSFLCLLLRSSIVSVLVYVGHNDIKSIFVRVSPTSWLTTGV